MIRSLQVNVAKPIQIVTAGEALTRGMAVTYDPATNSVSKATGNTGFGFVDVAANYDGINAAITPNDAQFESIKQGDLCLYISYYQGERIATNQITTTGLSAGNKCVASAGKVVKDASNGEWTYVGKYIDPDFDDMYIIQHL